MDKNINRTRTRNINNKIHRDKTKSDLKRDLKIFASLLVKIFLSFPKDLILFFFFLPFQLCIIETSVRLTTFHWLQAWGQRWRIITELINYPFGFASSQNFIEPEWRTLIRDTTCSEDTRIPTSTTDRWGRIPWAESARNSKGRT